jgi:hypothetical protein
LKAVVAANEDLVAEDGAILEGGCQCGAVRFRATGKPKWVAHCHCADCRRASAAPFTTYASFDAVNVAWTGAAPKSYASSPTVTRRFCETCGTPMSYESDGWAGEVHIFVAALDDPEALQPRLHAYVVDQLSWIHTDDGLRRYHQTAAEGDPLPG